MLRAGLVFLMLAISGSLSAANWLAIDPGAPVAGDEVAVQIGWGGSGLCRTSLENSDGERFGIEIEQNLIHFDLVLAPVPTPCIPMPPSVIAYALGSLPAGNYTLVVSEVGADTSFPVSNDERTELTSTVFGVAPAPMAIPVNQPLALALLAFLLLVAGTVFRRRRANH
jgi:hypothetical protein